MICGKPPKTKLLKTKVRTISPTGFVLLSYITDEGREVAIYRIVIETESDAIILMGRRFFFVFVYVIAEREK